MSPSPPGPRLPRPLRLAGTVLAGVSLLLACGDRPASSTAARAPSVILITIDSLRADHVGHSGHERAATPWLDGFADEAIYFSRCYAQASWTLPSMLSLMSSLPPPVIGVDHGIKVSRHGDPDAASRSLRASARAEVFSEEYLTLPEVLAGAGYHTAGFSTNGHLQTRQGFAQGFRHFDETSAMWGSAAEVLSAGLAWLEGDPELPVFLWIHLFDPHFDESGTPPIYRAPEPYRELFSSEESQTVEERTRIDYDRKIRFMDDQLGRFFAAVRRRGLYEDSILVIGVDHGEEFNEAGRWGHSRSVLESLVRVPLWIRLPRGELGGREVGAMVRNLDVAPTILDLLDIEVPPVMEGISLVRLIDGTAAGPGSAYGDTRRFDLDLHYWIDAGSDLKLIADLEAGKYELYDLAADPLERHDLAGDDPERVRALLGDLEGALREMESHKKAAAADAELDESELARLRALGYVE
jgi:arylsulfatase A-like enzyme